jgi:DNA-binding NarL/FixJ family response regulator
MMEIGEKILIADRDDEARTRLAELLSSAGYAVIQADRGDEALALARSAEPAAVLLEIPLDGLCGYEICQVLKSEPGFGAPVVFVSAARTEAYDRIGGLLLGADDYIVSPYESGELLVRLTNLIGRSLQRDAGVRWSLTVREREILDLMSEGLRHGEIAGRLFISPRTVATHVEHILRKLGVRSSKEAISIAYREEIIPAKAGRGSRVARRFRR